MSSTGAGKLWAEMIAQESVDEIADSLFTTASVRSSREEGLQERGTENYLSRLVGKRRKRRYSDTTLGHEEGQEGGQCGEEEDSRPPSPPRSIREYESDSGLSSEGLSDDSKVYVKKNIQAKKLNIKQRIALYKKRRMAMASSYESAVGTEGGEVKNVEVQGKGKVETDETIKMEQPETSLKVEPISKNEVMDVPEPQPGTSRMAADKGQKRSYKSQHLERLERKTDNEGVSFYILKRLREKKWFLIRNAVDILGRETCTRLFLKVTKINYYGGLLIKKRNKKRTMGGIFMYLIKNDKKISEEKKAALGEANQKSENEEKEKLKKKYSASSEAAEPMDTLMSNIMRRINPSVQTGVKQSNNVWNLDDNDDYAIQEANKPEETLPKRKIVEYADQFEF